MQTKIYKRIYKVKVASKKTWEEIARGAGIPLSSWMTGVPIKNPSDEEIQKLAVYFTSLNLPEYPNGVTFEYLRYGE